MTVMRQLQDGDPLLVNRCTTPFALERRHSRLIPWLPRLSLRVAFRAEISWIEEGGKSKCAVG
eukprot:6263530-Amphidinium_carterae.1